MVGTAAADGRIRSHVWTTSSNYRDSNEILELNEWHHIVQKWDGSNLYLYLNGNLDHSIPTSGNLASGDQPIRIGGGGIIGSAQYFFKGVIDELRIYKRALTHSEFSNCMILSKIIILSQETKIRS